MRTLQSGDTLIIHGARMTVVRISARFVYVEGSLGMMALEHETAMSAERG